MLNKRGQGLSTNAIILIVLGVFVLAFMIFGFTLGWSKIVPWLSTENVDSVVTACETACTTQSVFGYCSKLMKLDDGTSEFEESCFSFASLDKYVQFGVKRCPELIEACVETIGTQPAE